MKKRNKYKIKRVAFASLLLIFIFRPTFTTEIKTEKGISNLQKIIIGGEEQEIMIRGTNSDNTLALFLHGGPGLAQICYAKKYQKYLEEDFIVVNWDQRGAGKSYSFSLDKNSLTKEQLVDDAIELIDYLCEKYDKEKIILVGHSWGSELGMKILQKDSSKILAYVGVGQVVNQYEGEKISYDYAMELAEENHDLDSIRKLNELGLPPYKNVINGTLEKERIIKKLSPFKDKVNVTDDIIWGSLFSSESNGYDAIKYALGNKLSAEKLWGSDKDFNLLIDMNTIDIPVYFCAGRYDYTTPSSLVKRYHEILNAPYKEFIWFENSGHYPQYTEVEKFAEVLINIDNKY